MKIKIKEGFLLRKVAGDHVVVPVGEAGKVFHGMIRLNDTGAFLWEQCRRKRRRNRFYRQWQKNTKLMKALRPMIWTAFYKQLRNAEILEETNE